MKTIIRVSQCSITLEKGFNDCYIIFGKIIIKPDGMQIY